VFFSNKRFLLVFLVLILVLTPFWLMFDKVPLYAQDQQVQSEDVEKPFSEKLKDPAFVKKRLEEIQARLEQWNNLDREAVAKQYMVRETDVASRVNTYNAIESFYRRLVTAMEKTLTFSQELKKMEAAKEQPAGSLVEEKPPYNLSFYETYLDKIDTADQRAISLQNSIKQLKASAEATRSEIGKVESRVRVLKEQVDKVGLESVPDLTWEYQGAQLDEELKKVTLAFQTTRLGNLEKELSMVNMIKEREQRGANWIKEHLAYDEEDLNKNVAAYKEMFEKEKERISELNARKAEVEKKLVELQTRVETAKDPDKKAVAEAALREQEIWWDYYQNSIEDSEESLQYLSEAQSIWQQRYSLLKGKTKTDDLYKMRDEARARIAALSRTLFSLQASLTGVHGRLSKAQQDLENTEVPREILDHRKGIVKALENLVSDNLRFSSLVNQVLNLNTRLLSEVESKLSSVQITEKVSTLGKERIMAVLNAELMSGEGYTLTVRKLILALVILVLGIFLSKKLTNAIRRRMVRRNMDPTATMAVQKIVYYILVIVFIPITLNMVNIPLTAFAFLGGAMAIAIGFGAQNLFSNLITGFILMFQKPFKVNDIVQVDGITATIVEIGSRATTIRDFDNIEIMVPNSHFLSNKIINWTHSDKIIRGVVEVGVAYGSPVREVESLLMECARSHSKILKNPEPYVVFGNFGNSSLAFALYFWVDMRNASRFFVASDLRYMIDNAFAKNDIVIAFPQMDVHLDTPTGINLSRDSGEIMNMSNDQGKEDNQPDKDEEDHQDTQN